MAGKVWHAEHEAAKVEGCALCHPEDGSASSTTNEGKEQEPTPTLRFITCGEHPPYSRCYIQDDGTHLQRDSCICDENPKEDCPIDLHRYHAGKGLKGESTLHA